MAASWPVSKPTISQTDIVADGKVFVDPIKARWNALDEFLSHVCGTGSHSGDSCPTVGADCTISGAWTFTPQQTFSNGAAMNGKVIQNVGTPVDSTDAATKAYVDAIGGTPVQETDTTAFIGTSDFQTFITADITLSSITSVLILFTGSFGRRADTAAGQIQIRVDGEVVNLQALWSTQYGYGPADCSMHWLEVDLSAAAHTIDVQVKGASFNSFSGNNHFRVLTLIPQV